MVRSSAIIVNKDIFINNTSRVHFKILRKDSSKVDSNGESKI
jgi:hypothetical protein